MIKVDFHSVAAGPLKGSGCFVCTDPVGSTAMVAEVNKNGIGEFVLIACSASCVKKFRDHPHAQNYLADSMARAVEIQNEKFLNGH